MLARLFQRPITAVTLLVIITVASLGTTVLWNEPVSAETVIHVYLAETSIPYVTYMQEQIIPQFESLHPHIKVELQLGVWDIDPILVRYAGDAAPDVIQISSDIASYQHIVLPLNDFTADWDDLNDFPPVVLDAVTMDGELLAIPFHLGTRSLAYRKDMFAQAGLDPEQPPTTWEELALFGKQLTRTDSLGEIIVQGFATGADYLHFAPFLFQAGGQFMSDDLTEITFADDAGLEAVGFMSDLYHAHRLSSPAVGDFKAGGAAMEYVSPIYFFPGYIDEFPNEDIGIALPLSRNRQTQILLPNSWAIVNTTPHQEEAWAWLEFVSSLDAIIGLKRASGLVPPRLSVIHYEPWNEDVRWRTTFEGVSMSMTGSVKSPYFHHIRNHFVTPALQRVLYEEQSPAVAFEEEQRRAQTWLDEALGIPPPPRW